MYFEVLPTYSLTAILKVMESLTPLLFFPTDRNHYFQEKEAQDYTTKQLYKQKQPKPCFVDAFKVVTRLR